MKTAFDFRAALLVARTTSAETFMQIACDLVQYAPVEAEAYAAAPSKGACQKLTKALTLALPDVYEKNKLVIYGFERVWRDEATQHERDAMTAAWRGMSAEQYLAERNKRTKKSRDAKPSKAPEHFAPDAKPEVNAQLAPAATLVKGKAQSATDSRAIDVAHKIIDSDYKPTRAELVLLAEALIGDSE